MSKIRVNEYGNIVIDDDHISSQYYQSKNENYIVAFSSSHGIENQDGNIMEIPGRLYLIENKSKILWEKEFVKLDSLDKTFVSDGGQVILCSNKEYFLFNRDGQELFRYKFNSNIHGAEFSEKNSLLIITTRDPDNRIYCFNLSENKLLWEKDNLSLSSIHIISFLDSNIISLSNDRTKEDSYCIDFNGNLIEGSIKESAINKRYRLIRTAESKFYQKQYAEAEPLFLQACMITDEYLFCLNDIPGKDSDKLLKFINSTFGFDRLKIRKIEKIDNDKNLIITTDHNNFSLSFNNDKNNAILKIDDGRTYELIAKKENEKLNIYKNIICNEFEHEYLFKNIAETKYKLEKYTEAIEFWEKAIDVSKNYLKKLNVSETEHEQSYKNTEQNIFRGYRKIISIYKKQGKNDCVENIIQQFITKYPNQSNEVLPKQRSRKNKEESFLINPMNSSLSLKFIKKIKTQKKPSHIRFVDNELIYLDGSQKPYNLIKTNEFFEPEWKIHCLDAINNICCVDKAIIVHTTKWERYSSEAHKGTYPELSTDIAHTKLWFINTNGAEVSNFNFNSYVRFITSNSNYFVVWSVDSKIRIFNSAGDLVWDYDVKIVDKYHFKDLSISDTGLILYAVRDTAYLINKDKKELLAWECPKEPVNEDEDMEDSDKIYSDNAISIYAKVYAEPFNDIRSLKISSDSKYILLGCYSGDLFCLNSQNQVIWHQKIGSRQINEIISSNDGENLVIKSEDGYIYFIDKGIILNKYKLTNRRIIAEYHNNKQQFFISDGKEFSIFDKSGTLLSKIIFKNDVNWFDISEKLNAIAIASSDGIEIFSI